MILTMGFLLIFTAGTAASQHPPADMSRMPLMNMMETGSNCLTVIKDLKIEIEEIHGGIAITFTTRLGSLDELRWRIETLAKPYADGGLLVILGNRLIEGGVKYETVYRGARLILTPKNTVDFHAFRDQVREQLRRVEKRSCNLEHP